MYILRLCSACFKIFLLTNFVLASYLPTVVWHGLGDSASSDGIQSIVALIRNHTESIAIAIDNGPPEKSFFGNINEQLEKVHQQLKNDKRLRDGFNAIGFSQGGQFLRAYAERYDDPPLKALMTWGSQHAGIRDVPCSDAESATCASTRFLVKNSAFRSFVQSRVIPAQYYKGRVDAFQEYLDHSLFLADVNNERPSKNETYIKNLRSLAYLVLIQFDEDRTVVPRQSSLFEDEDKEGGIVPVHLTSYWHDLGLDYLAEKKALIQLHVPGEHMQIKQDDLIEFITRYFKNRQAQIPVHENL